MEEGDGEVEGEDDEAEWMEQRTLLVKGFWRSRDSSTSQSALERRRDPQ